MGEVPGKVPPFFLWKWGRGARVWLTRFKQQYIPRVRDVCLTPIFVKPTILLDFVPRELEVAINSSLFPKTNCRLNQTNRQFV